MPHIALQSENEDGELIAQFDSGKSIDAKIIDLSDEQSACLRFIDPYGDTVFNQLQLPALIDELATLKKRVLNNGLSQHIDLILNFVKDAKDTHVYVRFIGD